MSARAWTLFAGMSLVWGIPYLFIKVAVDGGMPPAFIASGAGSVHLRPPRSC